MDEERYGRDLTADFHRLTANEPPFRTDLDEALRAAERGGRRRRARARTIRGGAAAVLAVAASTALVLAWPQPDRAVKTSPAVVIPTEVATTARPPDPMDQVEQLARDIARPAGGVVRARDRDASLTEIVVSVKTRDGSFEVAAHVSNDGNDVKTWQESCRLDGSSCTELSFTPAMGVWARVYPGQPGRESLMLSAAAPKGNSLWVKIDNYAETADGSKDLGPTWKDAGITAAGLRRAVADSGLTTAR
jgi:hypothetical protein